MKKQLLVVLVALLAAPVYAQDLTGEEKAAYNSVCGRDKTSKDEFARNWARLKGSVFFPAAAEVAVETITAYCDGGIRTLEGLEGGILKVIKTAAGESLDDGIDWSTDPEFDEIDIRQLSVELSKLALPGVSMPNLAHNVGTPLEPSKLTMEGYTVKPMDQAACNDAVSQLQTGMNCNAYLEELVFVFNEAQVLYSSKTSVGAAVKLDRLDKQWTAFSDATIDQTPLELAWNGWRFRAKHENDRIFVRPPKRQTILLHPYLALDYTDGALGGDKLQAAVVMDIFGQKKVEPNDKAYIPSGWALHTAYSDREGIQDWGLGLSLHFNQKNSLGITFYDDEIGINFSYDLWETAKSTNTKVKEFRNKLDDVLADPAL
jgi:hypothetical protein